MALGGLLCLFGVALACKMRDNKAHAQAEPVAAAGPARSEKAAALAPVEEPTKALPEVKPASEVPTPPATPPASATLTIPPPPPASGEKPVAPGSESRPILIPASATTPPGEGVTPMAPTTPTAEAVPSWTAPRGSGKFTPPPARADEKVDTTRSMPLTPKAAPAPVLEVEAPGSAAAAEPPLAPVPGPVQSYRLRRAETLKSLARRSLGASERWGDIHRLNPNLKPDGLLAAGTVVRLPADACVQEDGEAVKPLPSLRPNKPAKVKVVLPLTGTFPVTLDDKKVLTLPRAIREQLGNSDTVLISPGPDKCLWLTSNVHLERLTHRLEQSPAGELDVRVFKRLYYAQTVKAPLKDGRVALTDRLAQFAGLQQEVVLVGIDDHFEVWDAARWRRYTQKKAAPADGVDPE
jgi:MraZ protein